CQREDDRIRTRPEVDDRVPAVAVGDDAAALLDENRARRFYGDARQDRSRGIPDDAGDRALRGGDRGQEREYHNGDYDTADGDPPHSTPSSGRKVLPEPNESSASAISAARSSAWCRRREESRCFPRG